jgi:hypothetical protein
MGMTRREERIAENESFFREVNERIDEVLTATVDREMIRFVCECGDSSCTERIPMTHDEYEAVRLESTTFAVHPGHVIPDVETVVLETDRFSVVRKQGDAADVVEDTDPRS